MTRACCLAGPGTADNSRLVEQGSGEDRQVGPVGSARSFKGDDCPEGGGSSADLRALRSVTVAPPPRVELSLARHGAFDLKSIA